MEIGKANTSGSDEIGRTGMTPEHRRHMRNEFDKKKDRFNSSMSKASVADADFNIDAENDGTPDKRIPGELFNFDMILDNRRFHVMCDMLLRINTDEDLTSYTKEKLDWALEKCASYRMTCYCAFSNAHKQSENWKDYHDRWMAVRRMDARKVIKMERTSERLRNIRKDIGQITAQEIDDYILTHHGTEHQKNVAIIQEWKENEGLFLELRDTLKDRGTHLQTLLKRVDDHNAPKMSSGE